MFHNSFHQSNNCKFRAKAKAPYVTIIVLLNSRIQMQAALLCERSDQVPNEQKNPSLTEAPLARGLVIVAIKVPNLFTNSTTQFAKSKTERVKLFNY